MIENPDFRWLIEAMISIRRLDHHTGRLAYSVLSSKLSLKNRGSLIKSVQKQMTHYLAEQKRKKHEAAGGKSDKQLDIVSMLQANHDPRTRTRLTQDEIWSEAQSLITTGNSSIRCIQQPLVVIRLSNNSYRKSKSNYHFQLHTVPSCSK